MCGIAGIIAPGGVDSAALVGMTQMIRYRGPDGFGFAFAGPDSSHPVELIHNGERLPVTVRPVIGLGARRLAILDVSNAGLQPMQSADGTCVITFNGEIYNYKEIREELEVVGHRFHTHTDTEVILHAYQEWGQDCLHRFNGMWAFALWDHARGTLFCSRDRFGVKPFYFALHDGKFYFASEIKQILQASGMSRTANPRTCFHFLEWGLLDFSNETFFEGVYQLPGGHSLTLRPEGNLAPVIRRYWELNVEPEMQLTDRAAADEFGSLFQRAVTLRLRSDVPVGVSLSGGLDSSSVLCMAAEISPQTEFQTFSACFDDAAIDEREYVAAVLAETDAVGHHTFPNGKSFWEALHTMTYHHDEPLGSVAAYSQWSVMAEARAHDVPVILSGQGGDESLCGYAKYQYFYLWHLLTQGDLKFFRQAMQWIRRGTSSYWSPSAVTRYLPSMFRGPFSLTKRVCTPELGQLASQAHSGLGAARSIAQRQKIDLIYCSIPALLHHEDRSSMAHSVESRLPFLDFQLVEFLLRCPASLKLRDGWSKWLLRDTMKGTLPEKIRLRKTKLGFHSPDTEWMRFGLQNGQRKIWDTPKLRMNRFLDGARFKQESRKFIEGSRDALPASAVFRAVALERWAEIFSVS